MKWRFKVLGSHTHVLVYVKGALSGVLCFRNEEFEDLLNKHQKMKEEAKCEDEGLIEFFDDNFTSVPSDGLTQQKQTK